MTYVLSVTLAIETHQESYEEFVTIIEELGGDIYELGVINNNGIFEQAFDLVFNTRDNAITVKKALRNRFEHIEISEVIER